MDALSLLALQLEWGADEALAPEPISRLQLRPAGPVAVSPPRTVAATQGPIPSAPAGVVAPVPVRPAQPATARPTVPASGARALAEAARDLEALRAAIPTFDGCSLRDTATRSVLPTGDPSAGIAIVGEVPDEDEDRAGHPFAGRAGDLLDRMLASIDLSRDRVLLLPLVPWRPPGSRAPNPIEMAACTPFLERALVLARPNFILCMGSRPARMVADSAIRAGAGWRKPVVEGLPDGARALAMRHPSYLLSHLPARKDAWSDLIRLRRALDRQDAGSSITDT